MPVRLVFSHLDRLELPAEVREVGRSFFVPDRPDEGEGDEDRITNRKFFEAVFDFRPPAEVQDRLMPGTGGQVVIPEQEEQ